MSRRNPRLPLAFGFTLIAVGCVLFATRLWAATTVALVSTCGGEAGQNVLALTETALSAETDITLVDRREVERVLREQELMHCGPSEADQAVTVGKLLGVQVFASLETVPNEKEALGLVVFDAASGVVLWDSVLPGTNIEQAAVEVDAAVKAGCEKRQRPAGGLTTVCILSVRNADLPRELDSLCQSIGNILQRQLVQSPSLAVLERQHLENVNKERQLPAGVQTNQLLPSLVVVELEISRGSVTNGLAAVAVLSDGTGAKLGRATTVVESGNPADLSDRLVVELEKLLKAAPSQIVVDRALEAERFAREARFLIDSGELVNALRASEAATALMPTNTEYQGRLAECLGRYADQRLQANRDDLGQCLDLAFRVLDISRNFHTQAIARTGTTDQWTGPERWVRGTYFWDNVLPVADDQDADTTRKVLEFQQQSRELILNVLDRLARTEVKDQRNYENYTNLLRWRLFDIERFASSSSLWTADTVDFYRCWMKMAEKFSMDWDGKELVCDRILARLCNEVKGPWRQGDMLARLNPSRWTPHIQHWGLEAEDVAQFDILFREMEHQSSPVISAYGRAGELSILLRNPSPSPTEVDQQYQRAKEFIREQIAAPRLWSPKEYRALLYNAALDLIDLLPDSKARRQEYQGLFEFMLQRKEIEYWVTIAVVDPHVHPYRHYDSSAVDIFPRPLFPDTPVDSAKFVENANRVRALFQSGEGCDIDTAAWSSNTGLFVRELDLIQIDIRTNAGEQVAVPWTSAKPLLLAPPAHSTGWPFINAAVDADAVYVVNAPKWNKPLELIRVPLDGGKTEHLGEILYHHEDYYGIPKAAKPAIGNRQIFVGTDMGIFELSLDGEDEKHITTVDGLPSDEVSSLACVDGKLYAAFEGGYLVSYDLSTGKCETLASSRRREAKNDLDNLSPPANIHFMIPDPEHHRVLFTVDMGMNVRCAPQLGLWQIDTTTRKLKQVLQLYDGPVWAGDTGDGNVLIRFQCSTAVYGKNASCDTAITGVISFELATDRTRYICAGEQKPARHKFPPPKDCAGCLDQSVRLTFSSMGGCGFLSLVKWAGIATNGSGVEYFPALRETAEMSLPVASRSFRLVGNSDQILTIVPSGVWLLNLKNNGGGK